MQIQSDVLGMPIERSAEPDGSALGVARLAGRAVGLVDLNASATWAPDRVFYPQRVAADREAMREKWRERIELAARAE
jgi:glycerol kinase